MPGSEGRGMRIHRPGYRTSTILALKKERLAEFQDEREIAKAPGQGRAIAESLGHEKAIAQARRERKHNPQARRE